MRKHTLKYQQTKKDLKELKIQYHNLAVEQKKQIKQGRNLIKSIISELRYELKSAKNKMHESQTINDYNFHFIHVKATQVYLKLFHSKILKDFLFLSDYEIYQLKLQIVLLTTQILEK